MPDLRAADRAAVASVEPLQSRARRVGEAAVRVDGDQPQPEPPGAGGVAGLGGRGAGLEQRLGQVGGETQRRLGRGGRGLGVAQPAQRGGEQRVRERVLRVGGDGAVERGLRRRPVGLGGGGPGAQQQAARVRLGDAVGAVEGLGGEVGPAGGEPLAGGVLEDDGPERRRAWRGSGFRRRGSAAARRSRGRRARRGRRPRTGGPRRRRRCGPRGPPPRGPWRDPRPRRRRTPRPTGFPRRQAAGRGRRGGAGGAWKGARERGDADAGDARAWLLGGGAGGKPRRLAGGRDHALAGEGRGDAGRRRGAGRLGRPRGRGPGDRRRRRAAGVAAARRRRRPGARAPCRRAGGGAGGVGRLPLDHRRLRRPAGRLGRRGGARSSRSASAAAAGWRPRPPGRRPGCPCTIFRLAGIYGPGRSVLDRLRAGRAQRVVKPGQVFSRIHVADIAAVLAASLARPDPGRAYNVADDLPAPPEVVIDYAAGLLGMPVPPTVAFEDAQLAAAGAELLAGIEAGREPADQGGAPGLARLPRLSVRTAGDPRRWRVSHSRRKSGRRSRIRRWHSPPPCFKDGQKPEEQPEGRTTR